MARYIRYNLPRFFHIWNVEEKPSGVRNDAYPSPYRPSPLVWLGVMWTAFLVLLTAPVFAMPVTGMFKTPSMEARKPFQLTREEAEKVVGEALTSRGVGAKVLASITSQRSEPLYAAATPLRIDVRDVTFDRQERRWSANLLFVSGDDVLSAMPASGRFEEILEVPVLRRTVRSGDIIGLGDIAIHDFPLGRTRPDTVTDLAALIGKSPVRTISPQRPIRAHEVANPTIVSKNSIVQMRYSSPGMEIVATGQAIEDGAQGDIISVRNTASRKVVRAVIQDANNVSVVVPGALPVQTSLLIGDAYATK